VAESGEHKENTANRGRVLGPSLGTLLTGAAAGPHRSQQIGFESKAPVGLVRGQCWKLIHRQQIMRRLGSALALEVCTRCDDDEPQLISYPAPRLCRVRATAHSDKSGLSNSSSAATSSQTRKGCSAEHNAGDECHHLLHEAASPSPDPGVMSDRLSSLNATA
jgi:hypothetical protein